MVVTIPTTPDEETALQDRKGVSATGGVILGANPEVVTLELPLSQDSRTPSIEGNADACGVSEAIEKTPLPWAQFSVLLFLQLAEPLTSNVIYPVSPTLDYCFGISNRALGSSIYLVCT